MARLPVVSGADAVKAFQRAGWRVDRQRGSTLRALIRSNVGRWPVRVVASRSPRKDVEHHGAEDRVMAAEASVGLMLWDG